MGTGAIACIAQATNLLTCCDTLTWLDIDAVQVSVERNKAIPVINDHMVAIASIPTTRSHSNVATICCPDRRTCPSPHINSGMTTPEALVDGAIGRPSEVTTANFGGCRYSARGIGNSLLVHKGLNTVGDDQFC